LGSNKESLVAKPLGPTARALIGLKNCVDCAKTEAVCKQTMSTKIEIDFISDFLKIDKRKMIPTLALFGCRVLLF
jgi:hypothetical protein